MSELSVREKTKKSEAITALKRPCCENSCISACSEVIRIVPAQMPCSYFQYAVNAGMKLYLSLPTYLPRYHAYCR